MNVLTTRAASVVLIAGAFLWTAAALRELTTISPVHWPLLAPSLVLGAVPTAAGAATALAALKGSPAARPFALAFLLTLVQALGVSALAPQLYLR